MKITKRQLKRIIKEYGGRPYDPTDPGAYERYRDNPTGDAPIGGVQDDGGSDPVEDYVAWAEENGHITPSASSVVASYIVEDPKREAYKVMIANAFGMMVSDISREVKRQQAEKSGMMGESRVKISKRQLRRIIKEALSKNMSEGYSVPEFSNSASMEDWVDELVDSDPEAEVDWDVIDPETGEIVIRAGESASEQQWYVAPKPEGPSPEELAAAEEEAEWDWDAYEREQEEKAAAKTKQYEDILARLNADAVAGGKDWAMDTMHDASNNPSMWQGGMNRHESPEDYVMGFGQDAAGDLADALTRYNGDRDVQELWNELKDTEGMGVYGGGYGRDLYNRPTKSVFKEIIADYFYNGISKGVEAYKQKYGTGS